MRDRHLFQKRDLLLIALLLISALIVSLIYAYVNHSEGEAIGQISYDGDLVQSVPLSKDRVFSFEKNPNVSFEIKDNAIAFVESDCPDKVCIHSGFLSHPGQMAACLPNLISIRIIPVTGHDDIDMIAN